MTVHVQGNGVRRALKVPFRMFVTCQATATKLTADEAQLGGLVRSTNTTMPLLRIF